MTTGRIVAYSPDEGTYALPAEHAASLTSDAGPDNLSHVMQFIPLLAGVEQEVVECFRQGECAVQLLRALSHLMAEDSDCPRRVADRRHPSARARGIRPPRCGDRRRRRRLRARPPST